MVTEIWDVDPTLDFLQYIGVVTPRRAIQCHITCSLRAIQQHSSYSLFGGVGIIVTFNFERGDNAQHSLQYLIWKHFMRTVKGMFTLSNTENNICSEISEMTKSSQWYQ